MSSSDSVAGASTDQHISGFEEEGTFQTDEPPTSTTPASGSSNAGINRLHANRGAPGDDPEKMTLDPIPANHTTQQ
ncbi:hypothetical protein [Actinoplanes regularis]|uniref:Uncharacterized protein n=1 Tax=Actinoplanes regularis TaxID=52697 RepID=A0A239BRN6_9ACTN|nr:hypothetical protein [Actinoplanes regularis]GIE88348.1 hypothetical protein Are01nite_48280 [Actinoplanes regularis]GLW30445.1 hypothetical protein Areg01_33850 [Actinoplanes regularis]SNS10081.1 hypothetical protein SAMN06264365_11068 [Actinoplanes regularis]